MQKSLFPASGAEVNQTAGIDTNGNGISTWSHHENRANDICPYDGKFYAPFDMTCVFHTNITHADGSISPYMSVFESDEIVSTPSGNSKVTFFCTHGGYNIQTPSGLLRKGTKFKQGDHFYTQGIEGGKDVEGNDVTYGAHIHIDARFGSGFVKFDNTPNYGWYYLSGDLPIEKVFFDNDTSLTWNDATWCIPFTLKSTDPFNPIGKPNGWNTYNGDWYYVRNNQCVTGWLMDANSWYYLESDGKMKKGWLASGNDWYWLSPTSGVMQISTFVDGDRFYVDADGKMVRSGWTLVGSDYYYFKDKIRDTDSRYADFADGEKVTNTWIPGSSWFYVKASGIMAKSESIAMDGKTYNFASNGACLNP